MHVDAILFVSILSFISVIKMSKYFMFGYFRLNFGELAVTNLKDSIISLVYLIAHEHMTTFLSEL